MWKSSAYFKGANGTLKEQACGTAFVTQAFAAVGKTAVAVGG